MKVKFQSCYLVAPEAHVAHSDIQMEIPESGYLWVLQEYKVSTVYMYKWVIFLS